MSALHATPPAGTAYLRARSDHEWADVPRYAVLSVTPELIERLRLLRSLVIAHREHEVEEIVVHGYPERWGGGSLSDEGWRTEMDRLSVSVDGFVYRAYVKHTDVMVETEFLGIDELVDGIANGQTIFGDLDASDLNEETTMEVA